VITDLLRRACLAPQWIAVRADWGGAIPGQ